MSQLSIIIKYVFEIWGFVYFVLWWSVVDLQERCNKSLHTDFVKLVCKTLSYLFVINLLYVLPLWSVADIFTGVYFLISQKSVRLSPPRDKLQYNCSSHNGSLPNRPTIYDISLILQESTFRQVVSIDRNLLNTHEIQKEIQYYFRSTVSNFFFWKTLPKT